MSMLDNCDSQKIELPKSMREIMVFLLLKENILSIQFVLLFFTCYTAHIQKSFPIFFVEYTTKAARKMGSKDHAI